MQRYKRGLSFLLIFYLKTSCKLQLRFFSIYISVMNIFLLDWCAMFAFHILLLILKVKIQIALLKNISSNFWHFQLLSFENYNFNVSIQNQICLQYHFGNQWFPGISGSLESPDSLCRWDDWILHPRKKLILFFLIKLPCFLLKLQISNLKFWFSKVANKIISSVDIWST